LNTSNRASSERIIDAHASALILNSSRYCANRFSRSSNRTFHRIAGMSRARNRTPWVNVSDSSCAAESGVGGLVEPREIAADHGHRRQRSFENRIFVAAVRASEANWALLRRDISRR